MMNRLTLSLFLSCVIALPASQLSGRSWGEEAPAAQPNRNTNTHTGEALLASLPTRPDYPVKMDTMSDDEFGKMFFTEIDLDHEDMKTVKPLVAKGDYTAAITAWAKVFQEHVAGVRVGVWDRFNWQPLDLIMDPKTVKIQHGPIIKDLGLPGDLDWHSPRDYHMHANFMWHPKSIIRGLEHNLAAEAGDGKPTPYSDEALLTRWSDVWRDYCSNNWRIGMRLARDPAAREVALRKAGLSAPNPGEGNRTEWAKLTPFAQQLCVGHWLVGNWAEQLVHAYHASPRLFAQYVPARTQAEMAYFFSVWPGVVLADQPAGGAIAQFSGRVMAYQKLVVLMPEFRRNARIKDLIRDGFAFLLETGTHPDGSNQTLSYNYAPWFMNMVDNLQNWIPDNQPAPDGWAAVTTHYKLERRWYANLYTPCGGQLILGMNAYGSGGSVTPGTDLARLKEAGFEIPLHYTSIAFPWHGLFITRNEWEPTALYAALANPRRGADHESEGNNKVHLEAYGRWMLVDNAGQGWADYYGASASKNVIHVDGLPQARMAGRGYAGAYALPLAGRWYTSAQFDLAESTYDQGYGPTAKPEKGRPPVQVVDVQHTRQLIFVKEAKLWLMVDVLDAPAEATHSYQQLWHFDHTFPREAVVTDAATLTVRTTQVGKPNLALFMAGPNDLDYRSYYAGGGDGSKALPAELRNIETPQASREHDPAVRGWQNLGNGYSGANSVPAVEVEATWRGAGRQTLVTALVPSPTEESPVVRVDRLDQPGVLGLVLTLSNGCTVRMETAIGEKPVAFVSPAVKAQSLVLVAVPGQPVRGLVIDAHGSTGREIEIKPDGDMRIIAPITVPTAFRWVGPAGREIPNYRLADSTGEEPR